MLLRERRQLARPQRSSDSKFRHRLILRIADRLRRTDVASCWIRSLVGWGL